MAQRSILSFLQRRDPSLPNTSPSRPMASREETRPGHPYRSPSSTSTSRSNSNTPSQHRGGNDPHNIVLKQVADETKVTLPVILAAIPDFKAHTSHLYDLDNLTPADPRRCPQYVLGSSDQHSGRRGTRIRVLDKDSFDAAIELDPGYTVHKHLNGTRNRTTNPVAVLNLASETSPGGGWQNGAMAQEESLCYRSSLYLSLNDSLYPIPSLGAIYSPDVIIIRNSSSDGHNLQCSDIPSCPVTSVISVAALRNPRLTYDRRRFKHDEQRTETKKKIRLLFRLAAKRGHTKLVLGALGCGVFNNPPREVAKCFLEVFREPEFKGGWWEDVVFAVLDNAPSGQGGTRGVGNFGQFYRELNGRCV